MLSMIWSNWWRHKERFILLLLGVFIISGGLSFLYGLSESNKGTVMDTLQNKWKVSYDIAVRPPGTSFGDEAAGLMEPNFQDGITGGISMEQLRQIKQIPGVSIAAPLAVIGYTEFSTPLNRSITFKDFGVYRLKQQVTVSNGVQNQTSTPSTYYDSYGPSDDSESLLSTNDPALLVGIDPVEEAKLVGLDQAVVPSLISHYFTSTDTSRVQVFDQKMAGISKFVDAPILISNQNSVNKSYTFQYEKLDIPYGTPEQEAELIAKVKAGGGVNYLDKIQSVSSNTVTVNVTPAQAAVAQEEVMMKSQADPALLLFSQRAKALSYETAQSPYPDRWPIAYRLKSYDTSDAAARDKFPEFYRPMDKIVDRNYPYAYYGVGLKVTYIGNYDPAKLQVSKDIDSLFPMDTYRAPSAKAIFDSEGRPANPQATIKPINNPLGLLTSPPTMLTTMEAAALIAGDRPISVIRIKVAGVDEVSDANQAKLEEIAEAIRAQTGLAADIMLGSSPQPVLIQVPKSGSQTAIGWMEQQWIKLGIALTLVNEVKLGFSGMLLLVILIAVLYVLATNMVSFLVRKREFAIMLSIGWRVSRIRRCS
ncbi:hypothetical protein [Paenibacillus sacheonensis]|uniref:ABC transporter permease n=1 Tax=Paenibacillus sacheonensis TaxID=742054 RepID=A0A7X5C0M2_9BACL|nr:hypothetical protein [Paenibacillus sacheonensis]MBM7568116.1 hypothetical protein [Paenibacillus sacheonensis]NBC71882.1 hypothetical protein [Paenibacillus sacheonensis]